MTEKAKTYRELKLQLEELLAWFENTDDIDIDQAREKYEEAEQVLAELETYLDNVKLSVEERTAKAKK